MSTTLRALLWMLLALFATLVAGCDSDPQRGDDVISSSDAATDTSTSSPDSAAPDGTDTGTPPADTANPDSAIAPDTADAPDATQAACPAGTLGAELGRNHLLIGGSMDDDAYSAAPFDLRYRYLAGTVPADGPCADCASGCSVEGQSCANTAGCAWWGCWQWDQLPPGQYIVDHITNTESAGGIPMITYYVWFSVAGSVEGQAEMDALADGARVSAYLADWRFLAQTVARATNGPVILHLEPDLWGFGHHVSDDPTTIPVAVSAAGASECASFGDHFAGLARCMAAIARAEAPNALLGLHASAWAAGADAWGNTDPSFDLAGHATQSAAFLRALGADELDLIVVEMSDRDAGFNDRWWDDTDATLPNFAQAISWVDTLSRDLGLPALWWQVPYGNESLDDTCDHYRDNRVDYVFDHPERFAEGNALGVAFGAGAGCQTSPASDDGHFLARASGYFAGQRACLCGTCP